MTSVEEVSEENKAHAIVPQNIVEHHAFPRWKDHGVDTDFVRISHEPEHP